MSMSPIHAFRLAMLATMCIAKSTPALAQRVNLAKYQIVLASGQNSTYQADFAVDGMASNFHAYRTNNVTSAHWLEIHYPRAVTIGSAHVYSGFNNDVAQGGLSEFKFQYHNGSSWTDVPGGTVTGNTSAERAVIFSNVVTSNRFRLHTDDDGIRTIREVALFVPNPVATVEQGFPIGTDVRLSLGHKRPTTASTIFNGNHAKRAVDGYVDDSSRWLCNGTAAGDTLEIDLIDTHTLGSAHLYSGFGSGPVSNPAENFTLEHWDGATWQPIPGAAFTSNANPSLVIPFTTPVTTSKIRYRTTTANLARIREMLVFPPKSGGYVLGQDVITRAPPAAVWETYEDSSYQLRCGITDGRFLGFTADAIRFSASSAGRDALGWQLLMNHRDGSYRIRHQATGKCLSLNQISSVDHDTVLLEEYSGMPHQDWFIQTIDSTYFRIVSAYNGMALQTRYGNWAVGNPMAVRPVDGSDLQRWQTQSPLHHAKKGIAATGPGISMPWGPDDWMRNTYPLFLHSSWSYGWGRQSASVFPYMGSHHSFNPMQWGDYSWTHGSNQGPPENLHCELQATAKPVHYLGFNEPDKTDQGLISVAEAIRRWPRLEARDVPMVSPAPASIEVNGTSNPALPAAGWMNDFVTQADALGYRRNYTAVHWYANPDSNSLVGRLEDIHQAYGKPVWLTEFSVVDWSGTSSWTKAANYNFLAEFLWRAESLPWLKRYSLFQYTQGNGSGFDRPEAPRSNTRNADGSLTAFGQLYAGWDGVTSVVNYKNYHLHNHSLYRRLQNTAVSDLVAGADPDTPATGTQWILIPGATANTVRIVSTRDGRRLRYWNGTYVGMAPADNASGQSEWRLVADQHGWFFIEHPQSGARLRMNTSGMPVHGSATGFTSEFKWRFVLPSSTDNTPPILASIPNQTVDEGSLLTFTASATDADLPASSLTYSLLNAPAGASIGSTSGVFTWTPSPAQGPATYNFIVRVSDGSLVHEQPLTITVNGFNTAPTLPPIPSQTIHEGSLLTFTVSATDNDLPADTLTYSLLGAPAGASVGSTTGTFSWIPTVTQGPGRFTFTMRVSDGSLFHDQTVTVIVTDEAGTDVLETWIVAGQSNAEGYGITASPVSGLVPSTTLSGVGRGDLNVTHNNIQMFQGTNDSNGIAFSAGLSLPVRNAWHAMTPYEGLAYDWGTGRGQESGRRFGPELAFGFEVQRRLGSSIALIKYARGSTSIAPSTEQTNNIWRDFDPTDGGRVNQYDQLVSTIQAAVSGLPAGQVLNIRGIVWMQGESDATSAHASSYQANLTEFISALRSQIGTIAGASDGRMTRSASSWNNLDVFVGTVRNTNSFRQTVIDAQNAVASADPNVITVDGTNGLGVMTTDDWGASGVHYDTAGQVLLGERFARAALARLVDVSESGGTTQVMEGGGIDSYTVRLTRAPSANVTISMTTNAQVGVSPTSLSFTPASWNMPQTVTVTAVDDILDESNHTGVITHVLSSSDSSFDQLSIAGVTAIIIDNDPNFTSYVSNPAYGIGENDRDFNDDPDGDGMVNGLEAFFGTHPGQPGTGLGAPGTNLATNTTTFTHPRNPELPEDLAINYQWSEDLTNWYAGDGMDGPAGGPRVTITSLTTNHVTTVTAVSNAAQSRIFLRAAVSQK